MRLVTVVLAVDQHRDDMDPQTVIDILWTAAEPRFQVEHISARLENRQLVVGVFVRGDGPDAYERCLEFVRTAIRASGTLSAIVDPHLF